MANGFSLEFHCPECDCPVTLPLRPTAKLPWLTSCQNCKKQFGVEAGEMARQIKLFMGLCQQIKASEEILSDAAIEVYVGGVKVRLPFKLLLTRLKSTFELRIGGKKATVVSRTEPAKRRSTT